MARAVDKRIRLDESVEEASLLDLPVGPLHMIISKLNLEKQKILRLASSKLKAEHSDCMLHCYKSFAYRHLRKPNLSAEQQRIDTVKQVLAHSTDYFISSGYHGMLTSDLLFFYKNLTNDMQGIDDGMEMNTFLHKFYTDVEETVVEWPNEAAARIAFNQRRLIYTMILLNLLRQFRDFRIASSGMNLMHWQLQLEVLGVHFAVRDSGGPLSDQDKLMDLLTIIAELLVIDKLHTYEARCTSIGRSMYVYGIREQFKLTTRSQILTVNLSILAPLAVRVLLENVLNGQVDITRPIHCPIVDMFSIQLHVKGRRCFIWDGAHHLDICVAALH
ncbi:hypothetical protein AWZ03_000535 [Drosophila navojoa]|uniref:Uncharacterized protein n=2 Tax=Drosophila navojoa TaxID=7232 RepID=A0A484BYU5_DRONA|nr:hypothetical protein AWZ03_000535 [Drosophila navojoa]